MLTTTELDLAIAAAERWPDGQDGEDLFVGGHSAISERDNDSAERYG